MNRRFIRPGLALPLLLVPIGFIVYLYALRAPFVFDDRMYITDNPLIKDLWNFTDFSGTRYLGFLSFALNYRLSGLTPFDFHLTNVIIHIINAHIVYILVKSLLTALSLKGFVLNSKDTGNFVAWFSFVTALLFLVHPVETQAVTYVTQRFASLATLFYLIAVVCYVKARLKSVSIANGEGAGGALALYVGAVVAAVAGMKTKEISFTIPFTVTICELLFFCNGGSGKQRRLWLLIPFYITLFIIPLTLLLKNGAPVDVFNETIADKIRGAQLSEASELSRFTYLITEFRVIVTYIRLLFFPVNQSIDYFYPYSKTFFELGTFSSFVLLATLFGSAVYVLQRSFKVKNLFGALYGFGILWFFLTLSIESSFIPIQDVIFEHRAYLPSIGLIMAFVSVIFYLSGRFFGKLKITWLSPIAPAVLFLVTAALILSVSSYKRNFIWTDEIALLTDAIAKNPDKLRLYYARALAYVSIERGRSILNVKNPITEQNLKSAIKDFNYVLAVNPSLSEAYINRGLAYGAIGMKAEAFEDINKSIRLSPAQVKAYLNRGQLHTFFGRYDEAIADFTFAIRKRPGFAGAYNSRAIAYSKRGDREKALADLIAACGLGDVLGCENMEKFKKGAR